MVYFGYLTRIVGYYSIRSMQDELLTMDEVKDILKVSRQMVYTLAKHQRHPLPVIHISESSPRVKRSELERWITEKGELTR